VAVARRGARTQIFRFDRSRESDDEWATRQTYVYGHFVLICATDECCRSANRTEDAGEIIEIRQSVLGEIAIHSGAQVSSVDVGTLLRRLLLFDTVVVKSVRLREISTLIRTFGKAGFLQLLNSGVLQISCETMALITGIAQNNVSIVPPHHFTFGRGEIAHREAFLRSELVSLQGVSGLKNAERAAMEETILAKLVRPPPDFGDKLQAQLTSDMRRNTPALKAAIAEQLKVKLLKSDRPLEVNVEEKKTSSSMSKPIWAASLGSLTRACIRCYRRRSLLWQT